MQFLIIRHGDPDYVHDSLTEKGFREAELLARRLKKEGVDKIYVSPLGRAAATAAPTAKALGLAPETLQWLREFPVTLAQTGHNPIRRANARGTFFPMSGTRRNACMIKTAGGIFRCTAIPA